MAARFTEDYKFMIDHLDAYLWHLNAPDQLGLVNTKFQKFLGKDEDISNAKLKDVIRTEKIEELIAVNQKLFMLGVKSEYYWPFILEDGSEKILRIKVKPKLDQHGEVDYLLCTAEDVTEERRSEKTLKRSKERYQAIFDQAPLAFVVSDNMTNIIDWNEAAEEMFGWRKEEVIGKNFNIIIPDSIYPEIAKITEKMFQGQSVHNINQNLCKDGKQKTVEWNNAIIQNQRGEVIEIISIAQDITAKLEIQEEIKKQREELKYSELRTKFFANISHELKTPLNLILSTLQVFKYYLQGTPALKDEEKLFHYHHLILQNTFRLLRLVNNLIDITLIDVDTFQLHLNNYDISEVLTKIIDSVDELMEEKKREFVFKNELSSLVIACDPFNLERIILNLISNSVKFTSVGDKIEVRLYQGDGTVNISVYDSGIGIKETDQEVIFEQFRQIDETFRRQQEGSGIGLALSKSLVELHGGSLEVESKINEYSRFTVKLPVRKLSKTEIDQNSKYTPDNLINKVAIEFSDIYDYD